MITHCELRYVKRRKCWHFHLVDHDGASVYQSAGSWPDAERDECERVARLFVFKLYRGAYRIKVPRREIRKATA